MGIVTSAIGFGGALGQFGLLTVSDFIGRRPATVLSFIIAAVFLWLFIHAGSSLPVLFGLLFVAAMFNFGALAILAGPIPAEAAPAGLVASAAGLVIGAGEIFGGGVAPSIAGAIAQHSGIQYTLYFALGGQLLGLVLALFLRETAPRRTRNARRGTRFGAGSRAEPRLVAGDSRLVGSPLTCDQACPALCHHRAQQPLFAAVAGH